MNEVKGSQGAGGSYINLSFQLRRLMSAEAVVLVNRIVAFLEVAFGLEFAE